MMFSYNRQKLNLIEEVPEVFTVSNAGTLEKNGRIYLDTKTERAVMAAIKHQNETYGSKKINFCFDGSLEVYTKALKNSKERACKKYLRIRNAGAGLGFGSLTMMMGSGINAQIKNDYISAAPSIIGGVAGMVAGLFICPVANERLNLLRQYDLHVLE